MSLEFAPPTTKALSTLGVQKYPPILSAQEERDLAIKLYENHDLDAARQLVLSHMRFVAFIAHGYKGYGLEQDDLIQEGTIGLMKAVKRFNPHKNVRLASFAVYWIRAEIHEFVFKNWKIVKVATTKAQRKLFFNLRSKKKRLAWMNMAEVNDIANDLGVTSKDVMEMEKRMTGQDIGFDAPNNDDDEKAYYPSQYLQSETVDPSEAAEAQDWQDHTQGLFTNALETLDDRSKDILASRWLVDKKATLEELAKKYGISAERIRQIEASAIGKLKVAVAE